MIRAILAAAALTAVAGGARAASPDAYEALKAMDGHWTVTAGGGRTREVDNSCARTGLFFVCEQSVAGKPAALVVFRPMHGEERKLTYRVQTLTAGGDKLGPWRELTIDDDTWTYADLEKSGQGRRQRTVITHSGPDYMHVEVQAEAKDDDWKTLSTESYQRAP
jgi:hypothetical protein